MVDLQDVLAARGLIKDGIKRTPIVRSRHFSSFCDGEVYLKLENQQITNSFKIRGALNRILRLSEDQRRRGIVTASAGNHGQAVAIAAERFSIPVRVIVPKNTPQVKIDKIKTYDVELLLYGSIYDEAERKAIDWAKKEGWTYVSPYNDEYVIAGQGTIALEILEDLPSAETIVVPVGGGGLISGISVAAKNIKPSTSIVGVQSRASPAMYESLKAGKIVDVKLSESIADGLFGGIERDSITFGIVQAYVDDLLLVEEEAIERAIVLLWEKEKQIVEGAGAASIALLMEYDHMFEGRTVVAIISGGNIEGELFQSILGSRPTDAA